MLLNTGETISWIPNCTNYAFRIDLNFFEIILEKTKLFITIGVLQKRFIFGHFLQICEIFFKKLTFLTKPLSESMVEKFTKNQKSENTVDKWYNCAKNVGKLVLM